MQRGPLNGWEAALTAYPFLTETKGALAPNP